MYHQRVFTNRNRGTQIKIVIRLTQAVGGLTPVQWGYSVEDTCLNNVGANPASMSCVEM